jgi:succinate dehydrogenase/fumarate reductase cytochrome b subunit
MSQEEQKDLFTKKHATLWRISMWANGLASITLFIFFIFACAQILQAFLSSSNQGQIAPIDFFSKGPLYILNILLSMSVVFLQGVVYYVTLKGIALGLDMVVETDINYRDQKAEGVSE